MTLFPTNAPSGKLFSTQLDADSDFIIETVRRARAQGFAEGVEAAAKIVDAIESNSIWPPFIAASIREASKTKGP